MSREVGTSDFRLEWYQFKIFYWYNESRQVGISDLRVEWYQSKIFYWNNVS